MLKILVACEESQAVTKEIRRLGHEAFSCDIIDQSGGHPEWHIMQDVLPLLNGNCTFKTTDGLTHTIVGKWDAIIAFPPCTHLAVSGAAHFEKKRADGRQREGIEFFCQFLFADCDHIAVENPVGIIAGDYIPKHFPDLAERYGLPRKPTQKIQPYEHGHPYTKTTCLWLKGFPVLIPTNILERPKEGWVNQSFTPDGRYGGFAGNFSGSKERSKTFDGVAKAIAEQWIPYLVAEQIKEEEMKMSEEFDLSDAPKEIKEELMNNAEKLEMQTTKKTLATVHDFNAAAQLKRLAEERKTLAGITPENERFANDVRAIEYALSVLEAVGL